MLGSAHKGLSGGAIAGIVIGCFVAASIIAFCVLFFLYKRDKDKEDDKKVIKVVFINDVMGKTDAFVGTVANKIKKTPEGSDKAETAVEEETAAPAEEETVTPEEEKPEE